MDTYDFIISTVKEAGEILKGSYNSDYTQTTKEGDLRNIVTELDLKINDFLIQKIKENFPEHSIYSEEGGGVSNEKEYLWVLDPIDGTANFSRRIPHFAISMGLLRSGIPIAGAVYNPITQELFSFKKGGGAFLDGKSIKVSNISEMPKAFILMVTGKREELRDWGAGMYRKLLDKANHTRNLGSSSLDICFIADGRVEGVVYGQLTSMDIAAAIGILLEAGGKITGHQDENIEFTDKPQKIVASNGTMLHKILLDEIV